jgi:hypothetical protein
MAISKEEKAVRDALAQLEKDAAVSDAAIARMNQATPASTYEQARSQLSEIKDPKIRAALEKSFAATDVQTQKLATEAAKVGLQVTPTGTLAPAPSALTSEQIAAQLAAAQAASTAAQAAELARQQQAAEAERLRRQGQSAYDILFTEFNQYGLGSLIEPLKNLIISGVSQAELTLALRQTDAYKKRFAANATRIANGLRALSEGEYIALEDSYQSIMRNYEVPATFYAKDSMGRQEGFEKLIAGDVKAPELEQRIILGKERILNGPAETKQAFRQFFPTISDGDILGYVLDPEKGLQEIKRKVTAAEIGGAAIGAGLGLNLTRAEQLAGAGITGESARQGYGAIAGMLPRAQQLSEFYKESPYTQQVAEQEIFNLAGGTEAANLRRKLTQTEQATFAGRSGITGGALGRERAGSI